jgi:hypothetical protein
MRSAACGAALAGSLAVSSSLHACPCQGSSGPVGAVTSQMDRFGVSLTETARVVHGAWRPNGTYSALAPGDMQSALDVTGTAGYRPIPVIELGAEAAFGHQSASSPYFSSRHTGFGDTTLRVRWDAIDEPMPYEKPPLPWPALTLVASLRIPTASLGRDESGVFSGTTGSVGSSASSEGLGTWEPGLSAALVRSIEERFQLSLVGEAAYRLPDTSLGLERHLAPRFFAQVGIRYAPSQTTGIGLLTDVGAEGNVELEGIERPATSQRLWTVGGYGYIRVEGTGLRWGALVRYAAPIDGIARNASRTTSEAESLGYVVQ